MWVNDKEGNQSSSIAIIGLTVDGVKVVNRI